MLEAIANTIILRNCTYIYVYKYSNGRPSVCLVTALVNFKIDPTGWDQNHAWDVFGTVILTLSAMYVIIKAEMQTQTADSFPGKIEFFYF